MPEPITDAGIDAAIASAEARFDQLIDTYPNVYVSSSGGKDSAVITEIAARVAVRRGITLPVVFVDHEALDPRAPDRHDRIGSQAPDDERRGVPDVRRGARRRDAGEVDGPDPEDLERWTVRAHLAVAGRQRRSAAARALQDLPEVRNMAPAVNLPQCDKCWSSNLADVKGCVKCLDCGYKADCDGF